ncbi:hypothetical protein FGSG_03848 [Fusarium graminearum PH-1]|uniref:hypothetical protein n=1 Tax=Gibberella zeae (strain ATCC MYA-4620 / CBS 123657 / FGSC 9075 / NRRL 31084 / PH-1) TaxID=229533 RepID=UPI00021F1333|nr:hypothetical protein FGSG_03848 [Fusarium graminearum PH-1]ESU09335.1 hypothetical protein FGSG_03848 [Fusarium graminearum PH-1]EYB21695.1 hypothetical protein FG05_03848 [Fusarium graminearum]|eukprot:XP_011321834.1 hypothetical protein FGSG_03848 [Fusarium graminearum PH-1]
MGAAISQLWTPPMIDIGVVGLPSAGKTAIIHKLSGGQKPTEPLNQRSQQYFIFDYSGNEKHLEIDKDLEENKNFRIVATSAITGENLVEGLEWMRQVVRANP